MNFIGRFENFDRDFSVVENHIRLSRNLTPHLNATVNKPPLQDVYDGETIEMVASIYAQDIATFGYSFDRNARI